MCQALPPLDSGGQRQLGCHKQSRFGRAVTSLGRRCHRMPHPIDPEAMLFSLALVIVVLSLLLTVLIGEQGLRGVPTRAT